METILGKGRFTKLKDGYDYQGTMIDLEEGEELDVVFMSSKYLEKIIKNEVLILLQSKLKMDANLYECENRKFADEITYDARDGTKHRLFLDRHFYSINPKDMIFVRYASVDQSFIEETP